jgi:hypothetical protein
MSLETIAWAVVQCVVLAIIATITFILVGLTLTIRHSRKWVKYATRKDQTNV